MGEDVSWDDRDSQGGRQIGLPRSLLTMLIRWRRFTPGFTRAYWEDSMPAAKQETFPYYVCPVCGNTVEREAPGVCPICNTIGSLFIRVDDSDKSILTESILTEIDSDGIDLKKSNSDKRMVIRLWEETLQEPPLPYNFIA